MLEKLEIPAWKIASGEITNTLLLDRVIATQKPIILSTGLSTNDEISSAVHYIKQAGNALALLQCTSQYPCNPENIGINVISEFKHTYDCAVGLSDHSGSIFSGLAAASQKIQVIEVHMTLSREMFGPDVIASITTQELKSLVEGIRYIETIINHPVDKSILRPEAKSLRDIFMKSLYAAKDIQAGEILSKEHLTAKKPGTGIPISEVTHVIGKTVKNNIKFNSMLQLDDLE